MKWILVEEPVIALGIFTVDGFLYSYCEICCVLVAIYKLVDVSRLFYRFVCSLHQSPAVHVLTLFSSEVRVVDVLANSNKWEDKNSALELLVEQGYQQRRKYADIEKVVHEAKLLREKINAARK